MAILSLTAEDDDGNSAAQPAPPRQQNGQRPSGQQRYDHARQHGKDPVTNDAPMWNDIEDAMAEDARRYAERLAKAPSSPQTNGSAPTRAPQPPTPQRPPQTRPQPLNAAPVGSPYDDAEYERLSRQVRTNDDALSPNEYNRYHELDRLRKEQFQAAKNAPQQATAVVAGPNPHPEGSVEYVLHEARAKAAGGMGWQQVWAYLSEYQQALGADWGAVVKEWRAIKASIAG